MVPCGSWSFFVCSWWFLVVLGDSWCSWLFLVVLGCFWWFLVNLGGSCGFLVVIYGSW